MNDTPCTASWPCRRLHARCCWDRWAPPLPAPCPSPPPTPPRWAAPRQLKELRELAPECRPARLAELAGAERLVAALTPAQLEATLPAAARAALRADLLPALESYMVMFANQAYTRGFQAAKQGNGNVDLAALL